VVGAALPAANLACGHVTLLNLWFVGLVLPAVHTATLTPNPPTPGVVLEGT